jgi:hypothetical protein
MIRRASVGLLLVFLAGCFGGSQSRHDTTQAAASSTQRVAGQPAAASPTCPITLPNRSVPPEGTDWGPEDSYGNGKLWTLFWPYNVVVADRGYVEDDGSIGMKWPWWRGVSGRLKIEGRRLDKPAPRLHADISSAYGVSGFQPSGIYFPSEGCWEVTGRVGEASLTFVTLIVKASSYGLELKRE